MLLAVVTGRVWSDRQLAGLDGRRFVTVRGVADDAALVAVDLLEVGTGDTVLVTTDEAAAAASGVSAVDAAVVALVAGYDDVAQSQHRLTGAGR